MEREIKRHKVRAEVDSKVSDRIVLMHPDRRTNRKRKKRSLFVE